LKFIDYEIEQTFEHSLDFAVEAAVGGLLPPGELVGDWANSFIRSSSIARGFVVVAYRFTGWPSLSIRNFEKFHLIASTMNPDCFILRYFHSGCASSPLTLILANISNFTPYLPCANCLISSLVPGSWFPNWLHGNAKMRSPLASAYFS